MSYVALLNLSTARGEARTYNGTHQVSATDSTPVNITSWTIKVQAKDFNGNVVLDKTATVTSGPSGTYSFAVTHADTATVGPGNYNMDIYRTDSGSETLMCYGAWNVTPDVRY